VNARLEERARQVMDITIDMKRAMNSDLALQLDVEDLLGHRHIYIVGIMPALPAAMEHVRTMQPVLVACIADAYLRTVVAADYVPGEYRRGEMERNFPLDPDVTEALVVTVMDAATLENVVLSVAYGRNDDGEFHFDEPALGEGSGGTNVIDIMREALR
jgi:hypothetical protein